MRASVYFIQCGDTGLVKIGWTSGPVCTRIEALQTGCPLPLRLIAEYRLPSEHLARSCERWFHRALQHVRVRGEWFAITPEGIADLPGVLESQAEGDAQVGQGVA